MYIRTRIKGLLIFIERNYLYALSIVWKKGDLWLNTDSSWKAIPNEIVLVYWTKILITECGMKIVNSNSNSKSFLIVAFFLY